MLALVLLISETRTSTRPHYLLGDRIYESMRSCCVLATISLEVHSVTCEEGTEGKQRYTSIISLTSAIDGVGGQRHGPAAFSPGKRSVTHCVGGWVGSRAGLDVCGKSRPPPPPGFDPHTVQPVLTPCSDYAIRVQGTTFVVEGNHIRYLIHC
jgi:hypothetical protein